MRTGVAGRPEPSPKGGPVVLIVEDDRLLATLLRLDLERNGYAVLPPVTSA